MAQQTRSCCSTHNLSQTCRTEADEKQVPLRFQTAVEMALKSSLSVGDILKLSHTAWKLGRAFTRGTKGAPSEFAEVERELNGLSEALKLVAESLHEDDSILSQAEDQTKHAVNTIFESVAKTLQDLESFVERYQVIKKHDSGYDFLEKRSWSSVVLANYRTFKWTTEGGDIHALRTMLQMHVDCIDLTMQALQSRSLTRLKKTVMPVSRNVASIHDKSSADLAQRIRDAHELIAHIVNNPPSAEPRGRRQTASHFPPFHDIAGYQDERNARVVDWNFETGTPSHLRGSISHGRDWCASPIDSAYAGECSRRTSLRRESLTIPALLFATAGENHPPAASTDSRPDIDEEKIEPPMMPPLPPLPLHSTRRLPQRSSSRRSASQSRSAELPPPPVMPFGAPRVRQPVATPSHFFPSHWTESEVTEGVQTARPRMKSPHRETVQAEARSVNLAAKFEQQLLRNAAILCDVRGRLVEFAQHNPEILDTRYNVEVRRSAAKTLSSPRPAPEHLLNSRPPVISR